MEEILLLETIRHSLHINLAEILLSTRKYIPVGKFFHALSSVVKKRVSTNERPYYNGYNCADSGTVSTIEQGSTLNS